VVQAVKEQRSHLLIEATQETKQAFFQKQLGLTESILFERECEKGVYEGYTNNYTPVKASSGENLCGQIISARITEVLSDFCIAEICE